MLHEVLVRLSVRVGQLGNIFILYSFILFFYNLDLFSTLLALIIKFYFSCVLGNVWNKCIYIYLLLILFK